MPGLGHSITAPSTAGRGRCGMAALAALPRSERTDDFLCRIIYRERSGLVATLTPWMDEDPATVARDFLHFPDGKTVRHLTSLAPFSHLARLLLNIQPAQSITQKCVHTHPLTAREHEHWFLQHLSHFIAVNSGRQ